MVITTLYCNAGSCKYHNGVGCTADFITIDVSGRCTGFEEE